MHQRQIIREAVKTALVAASTSAGSRVYETRMIPVRQADLPVISIYTNEETVIGESQSAPREIQRQIKLLVEGFVGPSSNVDDSLDALADQIERAMCADETFGGVASDCLLDNTDMDVMIEGDRPLGMLRLTYHVKYYTLIPDAADVVLDDLSTIDTRITSVNGGTTTIHTDNQAHDLTEDLET